MDTIAAVAASVIGARHLRAARNGQDAAVAWRGSGAAVVVVCDGCSSGASSEVGARLGAMWFARALAARLEAGESPADPEMWTAARAWVGRRITDAIEGLAVERAICDQFL